MSNVNVNVLVIVEHDNNLIKDSTLNTITAAKKLSAKIDLLVVGYNCQKITEYVSKINGVNKIIEADNICYKHFLAENLSAIIADYVKDYEYVLAPATTFGKNFMPCVAAYLDVEQISDVIAIEGPDTFLRPVYAGNALALVKSNAVTKVITIRTTTFDKEIVDESNSNNLKFRNLDVSSCHCEEQPKQSNLNPSIEKSNIEHDLQLSEFVSKKVEESLRPELTSAKVVIAGGRGFQNKEHFELLEKLADKLNAAIGATRAVVDAGIINNDYQIGQTGKVIAPDLYIGIGLSGAIQHVAGIKDSKVIVAINKDEDAPIFQVADYGIVGDLFKILPDFIAQLEKQNVINFA